jgi:hypothetical protein
MSAAVDFSGTRKIQWRASDPNSSAWVVANAGSGKTHVLTQRVVRLLLAGADPAAILCLTFTKVAAAEMSRRIFHKLGRWTRLPTAELPRSSTTRRAGLLLRPRSRRAPPVRPRAGNAWRPEDPDDSRLLRKAAAPVPVRGQRSRPFRRPRRHGSRRAPGERGRRCSRAAACPGKPAGQGGPLHGRARQRLADQDRRWTP